MKKLIVFPFLLIFFLSGAQDLLEFTIYHYGLCDVSSGICNRKPGNINLNSRIGWIESKNLDFKVYLRQMQETKVVHNITLTETITDNKAYTIWKGTDYADGAFSKDIILRAEYEGDYRVTFYIYNNKEGALGRYYICDRKRQ